MGRRSDGGGGGRAARDVILIGGFYGDEARTDALGRSHTPSTGGGGSVICEYI